MTTASTHHHPASAPRARRRSPSARKCLARRNRVLADYVDWRGVHRQLIARPGSGGSVLVLDRDTTTRGDRRLVAHLAPDEPAENADVASRCFIADARRRRCRCRALTADDLYAVPFCDDTAPDGAPLDDEASSIAPPSDRRGRRYRIEPFDTRKSTRELRWCRLDDRAICAGAGRRLTSVRDVVGALESYEPVRAQTARAVIEHRDDATISVAVLRAELARVNGSVIVLNRGIREAVLAALARDDTLSMSEIAMRCGRVKRDAAGNASGETSWLSRRLGLLPEGGHDTPTPWVHSDVLALIARDGLGVSPREVEVL